MALLTGAVVVLWLATRPYLGIRQDSRLYTFLAMYVADPARLGSDLFVQFGSQSRFTAFPQLYGPVLRLLGPSNAAMLLTAVASALWLGAAFWLAKTLLRDTVMALVAVAGSVALPSMFGPQFLFSYGENFLTPRPLVEAATMSVVALALSGRIGRAALLLIAAATLHPVMAIPGALILAAYAGLSQRLTWIAAVCAAFAVFGAAALGIRPFTGLLVAFDPAWLGTVATHASYLFLGQWSVADWTVTASQLLLACVIWRSLDGVCRRLLITVVAIALVGLLLTGIGADMLHNQLLTSLQFWRAGWLLAMVSNLLTVPALLRLFATEADNRVPHRVCAFAGVFLLFTARFLPLLYVGAVVALGLGAVLIVCPCGPHRLSQQGRTRLTAAAVGAAATIIYQVVASIISSPDTESDHLAQLWGLGICIVGLGIAASAALRLAQAWPSVSPVATAAVVGAILAASLNWDQRTEWTRFAEGASFRSNGLETFVPESGNVAWIDGLEVMWLRLQRPNYYSCSQGAGVVFNRGTAAAYEHRRESFRFGQYRAIYAGGVVVRLRPQQASRNCGERVPESLPSTTLSLRT